MTISTKRKIVRIGLVAVAVWPLIHPAVIRMTGISPWKLFGWAMYTVPARQVGIRVISLESGQPLPVGTPRLQTPEFLAAQNDFLDRRRALGRWQRPDRLALVLLDMFPDEPDVEIVVEQAVVDRSSALMILE